MFLKASSSFSIMVLIKIETPLSYKKNNISFLFLNRLDEQVLFGQITLEKDLPLKTKTIYGTLLPTEFTYLTSFKSEYKTLFLLLNNRNIHNTSIYSS